MDSHQVEILAPAGNFEKLKTAIQYGADSVYLAGQRFGLRAGGKNFSDSELSAAALYAHEHNCKAFVTVNAIARDDELEAIAAYGKKLYDDGFDAAIVSDPGVFACLRAAAPELALHISTQANVSNAAACLFWYQAGAKRIVLSRELSLAQIKQIRASVPPALELECFVHGAICLAHSGRCLLSAYFNDRSGNRGACTQPCRWEYQLQEIGRVDSDPLPIETDGEGTYLMSSKDLCMIDHIPELLDAGINSFKIEGRMKGLYYVAVTSQAYRCALDHHLKDPGAEALEWPRSELDLLVHREYSTGFYFNDPRNSAQLATHEGYLRPARVLAQAVDEAAESAAYQPAPDEYLMRQMNKMSLGEVVYLFSPNREGAQAIRIKSLKNLECEAITATPHPGQFFYLACDRTITPGSFIRSSD